MRDVIVIGAGIIGATIAKALENEGRDVLLLDDRRPFAGTPPSGGHLKPSWFGDLKKEEYEPAIQLLHDVWGEAVTEEDFEIRGPIVGKLLSTKVYRVDTDVVVTTPVTSGTVTSVRQATTTSPVVKWEQGEETCRLLIVATGAWAGELLPEISVQAKQGVSFRFRGACKPFIKPWAPYKQIVVHQQGPTEMWAGDGSAILFKNWTDERTEACRQRCFRAIGTKPQLLKVLTGLRPYCSLPSGEPCLLKKLGPAAWVATGAGKSGTISAGWAARRIVDASH